MGGTRPAASPEGLGDTGSSPGGNGAASRGRGDWAGWVSSRIATLALQIDRSERVERHLRDWSSGFAPDFWEDDQALAVAGLGEELDGGDPARVVSQLRQTPAGLAWLADRWRSLAQLGPGAWTDADREYAARLLGGDGNVDPTVPGFAAARVEELEADRPRVEEADALLRGLVEAGSTAATVPDSCRVPRQYRRWMRQVRWRVE